VWYPEHTDPEFDAIFGRTVSPPADPVIHACVPDDPSMHPADSEAWTLMVNVPAHGSGPGRLDWRAPGLADRYATHLVDVLAARGTDIRDRILWHEVRTPADLEDAAAAPGGAIYGWSSNGPRAAFARPANTSSVRGLYLVGGSVHPGGGLPLVGMGAETVTGLIGRA
jgi:phytoene dehydrogenase-like protein